MTAYRMNRMNYELMGCKIRAWEITPHFIQMNKIKS